jgi:ribonuclease E
MTAFKVNQEAVREICRQLKLRDLGGVIVIDFIDMREERHKREIEHMLREELKKDRAKTKVLRMSQFCMVELTRQRMKPSLKRSIYMDCPHCHGAGLIKNPESVSLDVLRRIAAAAMHAKVAVLEVRVYTAVADYLLNKKRRELLAAEDKTNRKINIIADEQAAGDSVVITATDARGVDLRLEL